MLALALELTPRGHVVVVMFTVADGARRLAGLRFTGAPISARSRRCCTSICRRCEPGRRFDRGMLRQRQCQHLSRAGR